MHCRSQPARSYRDSAPEGALSSEGCSGAIKHLSGYGEVVTNVSIPIRHDPGERKFMRQDGLQREAVHSWRYASRGEPGHPAGSPDMGNLRVSSLS